jgi:thioredoxin 1
MAPEILIRLAWAAALIALGLILYFSFNRISLRRARGLRPGLESVQAGRPVLVYFTTPTCAPCKTVQRPAIARLRDLMGECLQVVEIDASVRPEVASQWGVMSVPTTFVLDEQGQPQHVNHGVAPYDKLIRQLANLCPGT